MLELYDFPNSVCSQKVRLLLAEKGVECKRHDVNLFASEQYNEEYLRLNPKGYVPTIIHNGKAIRESSLICEYLNDAFPEPPLAPLDPADRAAMRLWTKAVDDGLFEAVVVLSFSAMFRERLKNLPEEMREARFRNIGDPTRGDRLKSTFEDGVESRYVYRGIAAFEMAFKGIDGALSDGNVWLANNMFSLAEINLTPMLARLEYLTLLDIWLSRRPVVKKWWERVKQRTSYDAEVVGMLSEDEVGEMQTSGARIKDRIFDIHANYIKSLGD